MLIVKVELLYVNPDKSTFTMISGWLNQVKPSLLNQMIPILDKSTYVATLLSIQTLRIFISNAMRYQQIHKAILLKRSSCTAAISLGSKELVYQQVPYKEKSL